MTDGQAQSTPEAPNTEAVTPELSQATTVAENPATPTDGVTPPENKSDTTGDAPAWLPARLERAKENAVKEFLASLELESAEQIKTVLAQHKADQEAKMTEQEKRDAELAAWQSKFETEHATRTQLEQQLADFQKQQLDHRRETTLQTALANTLNPKAVFLLIKDEYPDDYAKILDEDGKVNETAVKSVVDKASTAHGQLFRVSSSVGSPPSANRAHSGQSTKMSPEELQAQIRRRF